MLLFGGLFCLYAVNRNDHPEMCAYGGQFRDTCWGVVNIIWIFLFPLLNLIT